MPSKGHAIIKLRKVKTKERILRAIEERRSLSIKDHGMKDNGFPIRNDAGPKRGLQDTVHTQW